MIYLIKKNNTHQLRVAYMIQKIKSSLRYEVGATIQDIESGEVFIVNDCKDSNFGYELHLIDADSYDEVNELFTQLVKGLEDAQMPDSDLFVLLNTVSRLEDIVKKGIV